MFRQLLKLYARHYRAAFKNLKYGVVAALAAAPVLANGYPPPFANDPQRMRNYQEIIQKPLSLFISWNDLCYKMLSRGEVERVIVDSQKNIIQVILHDGAIIDGRPVLNRNYFLQVPNSQLFESKLRAFEISMGIKPDDYVPIVYQRNDRSPIATITVFLLSSYLVYIMLSKGKKGMPSMDPMNMFSKLKQVKFTLVDPIARAADPLTIRFKDVAGLREAKVEVMEFVEYLKNSEKFLKLGAKLPKGILLTGPPGCGKTLLAKAVATEANVPFMALAGSDFVEMIGGLGAARVRNLFKNARKLSPCIIYIDEIDSIGKKRGGWSNREGEQTLNQLLIEMDGMISRTGIILLASTNRAEVLDQALTRAGRFDRQILIDLPNLEERKEIFEKHSSKIKLDKQSSIYSSRIAQLTPGMSGADIANVCNEAALHAARQDKSTVSLDDIEYAIERVVGGTEKRSSSMSATERRMIAYHECGHALVGWLLEHTEPLLKVSIVPRTKGILGFAQYIPSDQKLYSKEQLFDRMCMALGGRVAELLKFNQLSTGAQNDLERVTKIAMAQIKQYGFDDVIGHISFPLENPSSDFASAKPYSKRLANVIDQRASLLVAEAFKSTQELLSNNMEKLELLAEALLAKEVMNASDVEKLIGPRPYQNNQSSNAANGL